MNAIATVMALLVGASLVYCNDVAPIHLGPSYFDIHRIMQNSDGTIINHAIKVMPVVCDPSTANWVSIHSSANQEVEWIKCQFEWRTKVGPCTAEHSDNNGEPYSEHRTCTSAFKVAVPFNVELVYPIPDDDTWYELAFHKDKLTPEAGERGGGDLQGDSWLRVVQKRETY